MRSTLRRSIGLIAIVLVAGLPAARAACEILCAPGAHAAAGDASAVPERHAAACHGASDSLAPVLAAVPAHGCGDHTGTPMEVAVWLKAGRFDHGMRPLEPQLPAAAVERTTVPVLLRLPSTDPPPAPSSYTLASVVLRI